MTSRQLIVIAFFGFRGVSSGTPVIIIKGVSFFYSAASVFYEQKLIR